MTRDELRGALQHPNVQAFLRVIREGESGQTDDAYRIMYGGGFFSSFNDHPRQKNTAAGITSTAAGAYQFLERTWDGLVAKYGFDDFSPATQDEAAVALIQGRGALQDLLRGDLSEVLDKCSYEWASLPPNRYGQSTLDPKRVYATYEKWLHPITVPPEIPIPPLKEEKKKMPAPFIGLALEALLTSIPTLIRHFGKGTRSEDNAKLAEVIVPLAKDALGAVNEQEVIERIQNDPTAIQTVDKVMQEKWITVAEAGGGGIKGAREADLAFVQSDGPWWQVFRSPSFWALLLLLPLVYLIVLSIIGILGPVQWSDDVRAAMAGTIVGTIVGGAVGYYWGQVTTKNRAPAP